MKGVVYQLRATAPNEFFEQPSCSFGDGNYFAVDEAGSFVKSAHEQDQLIGSVSQLEQLQLTGVISQHVQRGNTPVIDLNLISD
ncbi:hypothetical protein T265_09869 [Opisthorchis viverrini]|uniref:Uncharacterized protein n=1 Tax=Opisthorchis viverrini TaxID=6198 RepID=A0A074Z495_OPIVI|nr:hypothetical protein T265_09869 [Opisthorchis viverrini]KER21916.1 hypothetical protein T265_09869 [Opisthorchis viverrini]